MTTSRFFLFSQVWTGRGRGAPSGHLSHSISDLHHSYIYTTIEDKSHLSLLNSDKLMPKWVIYSLSIIQVSNQDRRKMGEVGGKFSEGFDSHFLKYSSSIGLSSDLASKVL